MVGDPCPAGGLLRRQDAGLRKSSRKPSARSRVNGFAAPSAPLTARRFPAILYPRGGGQATACNIDFALFYASEAFTQNLKKSLGLDFFLASKQELTEIQVFLDISESTFGLDGTVDPKQLAFGRGNFTFHRFPLPLEAFGDVQDFMPFFQWLLTAARLNAFFFQGAFVTSVTFIHAGSDLEAGR